MTKPIDSFTRMNESIPVIDDNDRRACSPWILLFMLFGAVFWYAVVKGADMLWRYLVP